MDGDCIKMPRFFVDPQYIGPETITVEGENYNHIKNVLRLKKDDSIVICDGLGTDYSGYIEDFGQGIVKVKIIKTERNKTEPPVKVTLYQGLPKADKMEYIIQKSVELGIARIVPVITGRTIVKLDGAKDSEKKTSRWQKIASEAAKQCNRGIIPSVELPITFKVALNSVKESGFNLIPYENEQEVTLSSSLTKASGNRDISFFIGPEGGFTEEEVDMAKKSGVISVSLGPRILRTETAGISLLSIIMYELGDMGKKSF